MTKFKVRAGKLVGKTEVSVTLVNGQKVKVNATDWTEVDNSDFNHSSINPNFFEVEGETEKSDKAKKPK